MLPWSSGISRAAVATTHLSNRLPQPLPPVPDLGAAAELEMGRGMELGVGITVVAERERARFRQKDESKTWCKKRRYRGVPAGVCGAFVGLGEEKKLRFWVGRDHTTENSCDPLLSLPLNPPGQDYIQQLLQQGVSRWLQEAKQILCLSFNCN